MRGLLLCVLYAVNVFAVESAERPQSDLFDRLGFSINLPKHLHQGIPGHSLPWEKRGVGEQAPDTGVIRDYSFKITRGFRSIDGFNKSFILVNNQFPGPKIEANWGDTIRVEVVNNLQGEEEEGTSLHWHGLTQIKTPWFDGIPGVSQCPIAPSKRLTYTFQADQYGTSWYHSHYSSQYNDGLFGPMIIYGPTQPGIKYDQDLGPILLSDYIHVNYYKALQDVFSIPPVFPNVDNNLINGRGCQITDGKSGCTSSDGLPSYNFKAGKTYRLRLINASGAANQKFTIDNHEMTVFAYDFVPIIPYKTKVVTLGIGQRADVLVKATGKPEDAAWMRSDIDLDCLNLTTTNSQAKASIYYERANKQNKPKGKATPWTSNRCRNDALSSTVPYTKIQPPSKPATSQNIEITLGLNETGHVVFFVDGSSFRTNYDHPILLLSKAGNTSYPYSPQWNVYNFGANDSVRVVLKNTYEQQHPIHLHGHNFWVLNEGLGKWDGTVVNPSNPMRRDTHIMAPGTVDNPSFVALEWKQDNPGVWPLHCHTSIHVSAGLYINVIEQPDKIKKERQIPKSLANTCREWAAFSGTEFVNQIDSGV